MNNTFTGHNTFIFLFPTRPRAFFLALICSGCNGLGWTDPRVYAQEATSVEFSMTPLLYAVLLALR